MTGRYVLSPRAQTDLGDIWDYTADRWGLAEGIDIVRILHERMDFARHIPLAPTLFALIAWLQQPAAEVRAA